MKFVYVVNDDGRIFIVSLLLCPRLLRFFSRILSYVRLHRTDFSFVVPIVLKVHLIFLILFFVVDKSFDHT